jgi:hypothetical protein
MCCVVPNRDEDEDDADDFMAEVAIPIVDLVPGEVSTNWYDCEPVGRLYIQTGLTMGMQRDDNTQRLQELKEEKKEMEKAPIHFRYSLAQAKVLLERTLEYEENLEQQAVDLEERVAEERRTVAKIQKRLYDEQQNQSSKRRAEKKKLMEQKSALEEMEAAAEKWNAADETDDEGCCEEYCDCLLEVPIPTVVKACYGLYLATGVLTLLLGLMVHKKVGYIESTFSLGVAGSGACMVVIGALVVLTASTHKKWWIFFVVLLLNVLQLVVLGFVACDAGLQYIGVSNQVLPLVKDWWGAGGPHPSHALGQNLQCILAIQDGFAGEAKIDTAIEAFVLVIDEKCGASIKHRLDMFLPQSKAPTFGFQCRDAARAPCAEWENKFFEAATATCSDTQYTTASDCTTNGASWSPASVDYTVATNDDAVRLSVCAVLQLFVLSRYLRDDSWLSNSHSLTLSLCVRPVLYGVQNTLDTEGGTCLPASSGGGLDEAACQALASPSSWNVGSCSDGASTTRADCVTAEGTWSVPVTTDTFKYGVEYAFQAASTDCDMISTPYLKEHCEQCSHDCMFARSKKLQTGFSLGSSMLILTYLVALCAVGYLLRPILAYKPDLNRDWSPRFSTLRDKNGWVRANTAGNLNLGVSRNRFCDLLADPDSRNFSRFYTNIRRSRYNGRLLESEDKTVSMLKCAATCQGITVLTSVIAVALILLGHADITRTCGLVQPVDGVVRARVRTRLT